MVELNLGLYLNPKEVEEDTEVSFVNEGKKETPTETGFETPSFRISVRLSNGELREWTMNLTSQRSVGQKYGTNTLNWVGKKVTLTKAKIMVKGKEKEAIFVKEAIEE